MDVVVYLVENWDIVTLLFTNVVALYLKRPSFVRRKEDKML